MKTFTIILVIILVVIMTILATKVDKYRTKIEALSTENEFLSSLVKLKDEQLEERITELRATDLSWKNVSDLYRRAMGGKFVAKENLDILYSEEE